MATRNIPLYRDPAVLLIDQLKKIHVEGELDVIDTSVWFPKIARGEYSVGLNLTAAALDDPDVSFYENYACGSERNYTKYCNPRRRKADRCAVARDRPDQTQATSCGRWKKPGAGRCPADHHAQRRRTVLATLRERLRAAAQQSLQQLALRRRVARQIIRRADAMRGRCRNVACATFRTPAYAIKSATPPPPCGPPARCRRAGP